MSRRGLRVRSTVLTLGLAPAIWTGWLAASDGLGANPVEELSHITGDWTLRLIVLTLAVTPARRFLGWSWLAPERRTLGLLAFAYACLHLATYAVLDLGLEISFLVEDVLERPYITVGFASFLMLVPLAATSTRAAVRRLGSRHWTRLHRLVYVAAIGGVVHFLWLVKADLREPLIYATVVAVLLIARTTVAAHLPVLGRTKH